MVADLSSDAVFGFAKQGHPQAIAVLLNRALVPEGAHVKVRQKKGLLKVLINFLRETDLDVLVQRVQDTLNEISPSQVDRVQIFTQRLGDRQAAFRKEISTSGRTEKKRNSSAKVEFEAPVSPSIQPRPGFSARTVKKTSPSSSKTEAPSNRYSVAEYLAQVTDIDDLKVLEDHPFFTGVCPHCHHGYADLEHPPLFWDCPSCGWRDDLSQKIPRDRLRETPQRQKISQGKLLGSYFIEAGLLSPAQIEVALADQQLNGVRLGEVLVRRGWIKEETVEYMMRKVIEPERQSSGKQAEAYLESSRNLLKTLIQTNKDHQEQTTSADLQTQSSNVQPEQTPASNIQINEKETLILSERQLSERPMKHGTNFVNERETLHLPESEVSKLIDKE